MEKPMAAMNNPMVTKERATPAASATGPSRCADAADPKTMGRSGNTQGESTDSRPATKAKLRMPKPIACAYSAFLIRPLSAPGLVLPTERRGLRNRRALFILPPIGVLQSSLPEATELIVHLHASCWNEERMLPFFFRHYDGLVDHYFIRDNQSTDGSLRILNAHPRVTVLPLFLEGELMVGAAFAQVNQFWHPSRGQADWVAVCNIDELFWHIDLPWYLRECRRRGITFLPSTGYQMVSESFPESGDNLVRTHRLGVRQGTLDKPAFFNPDAITESGFELARHSCNPKGQIVRPARDEIVLLHYKFLGLDYVTARHAELNARRRPGDIASDYGFHYEPDQTKAAYDDLFARRSKIIPRYQGILRRLKRRLLGPKVQARGATA